jgi:hypothetical protein
VLSFLLASPPKSYTHSILLIRATYPAHLILIALIILIRLLPLIHLYIISVEGHPVIMISPNIRAVYLKRKKDNSQYLILRGNVFRPRLRLQYRSKLRCFALSFIAAISWSIF